MKNLARRVEKIEARDRPQRLIVASQQYPDEPDSSLRARWEANNPGQTWCFASSEIRALQNM
jgi:hypothetical protein